MTIEEIRNRSKQYASGKEGTISDIPPSEITVEWLASTLHTRTAVYVKRLKLQQIGQNYTKYINSTHWKTFRKAYIKQRGIACVVVNCDRIGKILHHRTYANLGYESFNDVFLVCVHHHDTIHNLIRRRYYNRQQSSKSHNHQSPPKQLYRENKIDINPNNLPWGGLFDRNFDTEKIVSSPSKDTWNISA